MYLISNKARNEKKISKKLNIKSLGNIPLNSNKKSIMIENDPKANIMRYLKDIRESIINDKSKAKTISVISTHKGDGKSWVANNLAISLARINKKVLLVDANLRKKTKKSETFYIKDGEGLSDFIIDIELDNKMNNINKTKKYIQKTQIPNLYILPNGTITINSHELLKTTKMRELIEVLKEIYDYVIIDGTAFLENLDCINIAPIVDSNIIIIEENKATYEELENLIEEIRYNNGEIIGFILNKTDVKKGKYYGKENNKKIGIYIENTKKNNSKDQTIDDIIKPVVNKLEEKNISKFDKLHKEINNDILIEDFINDIEVNFNTRLEQIEKVNFDNTSKILENINQTEENMKQIIETIDAKRGKEYRVFYKFCKYVLKELQNLKKEINEYKINQEITQDLQISKLIEQIKIQNKNIENLKEQVENIKFDEQFHTLSEKIDKELNKKINKNESKKSNIIDLRKLFTENKRDEKIYSLNDSISFEELEELAIDIINIENSDNMYESSIF